MDTHEPLAVVGMACRLPGAPTVGAYWAALRAGTEGITRFRIEDLLAAGADPERVRHPDFVPAMGVLAGATDFDWSHFGYSRAEAAGIDPQQRVFLEAAATALDDAALDPTRFPGRIGVYGGADQVGADDSPRDGDEMGELARFIGRERDFLATRVAYKLGLRGPAVTVQTACSTSLTAVHLAAAALRAGECDAALAGGVAVADRRDRGYRYEPGGILSPDGHCRPFDADAAGTVPSEGVGVVVLRRLADALRDGDRIAAVLMGSAINNDGAEKMGYTAPSVSGQSEVIRHAQRMAGVDPADLDYIEAHGTATPIGDPVEVQALTDAFGPAGGSDTGWCRLGAVKSNLGHTGSAAGVAGLIKTVLMLERGELVPTVHYRRPNPLQELETTPFLVADRHQPWPERGVRLAAVSSFGVGGTNAHVILGQPPQRPGPVAGRGARALTLSAATPGALETTGAQLAAVLREEPDADLAEVARSLTERRAHRHRRTVVADSAAEAAELLAAPAAPSSRAATGRPAIAFLFPGHGPLSYAAGASAYRLLPGFRDHFDTLRAHVRATHGIDLSPVVDEQAAEPGWFSDLTHHHLGLFALGHALGRQLLDWGVRPVAMLGNSVGEYAPAALAGLWEPTVAADLVHRRAAAMADTVPGGMAAVHAPYEEVTARLRPGDEVTVAVLGAGAVVLSGPEEAMDRLLAGDALAGLDVRRLNIRQASHCAAMEPAAETLAKAVATAPNAAPGLRFVSNTTGTFADPGAVRGSDYWSEQLRRPVRLADAVGTLLTAGCDTFVELGPGTSMLGTARRHPDWPAGHRTVPMLGREEDTARGIPAALGALWESGVDEVRQALLDLDLADGGRATRRSLPGHPFARVSPQAAPSPGPRPAAAPAGARTTQVTGRTRILAAVEELWCAALGVPRAAEGDHFFRLGGESLMAVQLLTRVRERTGIAVPVAEFTAHPTFGTLLAHAAAHPDPEPEPVTVAPAPGPGPVTVVTLAPDGPGLPLFLIADSTGGSLAYRSLAGELDGTRPVHALDLDLAPAGGTPRAESVAALAAHHVAALRRVRPTGPYLLGGWSFGAVLAHEAARQLVAAGERVNAVVCLDAFVQGRYGLPVGLDPEFLAGQAWVRIGAALGVGAVGAAVRRDPGLPRVLRAKSRTLAVYRPAPVATRAVVLRAGTDRRQARRLLGRLAPLYAQGVEIHPVPGDHWSLLTPPHVGVLAQRLRTVLSRVEGSGHDH
ncbi:acyltransferase domain-containing protein [Streptomyces sp. JH002]|uniref:type I polyketide synthase n=1 Tax=Streptomyces sp. JH002 TaxID=2763259 RepID=UPI003D809678